MGGWTTQLGLLFRRTTNRGMAAVMAGTRDLVDRGDRARPVCVLLAEDTRTREVAARLAADADPSNAFGVAVREVFTEVATGTR